MKAIVILHGMKECPLCKEGRKLLTEFKVKYRYVTDNPVKDRPYPYITVEWEFEDFIDAISRDKII